MTPFDPTKGESTTFLVVSTENGPYGLAVGDVVKLVGAKELTPLPNGKRGVMGLVSYEDHVVTVLDLAWIAEQRQLVQKRPVIAILKDHNGDMIGIAVYRIKGIFKEKLEDLDAEHTPKVADTGMTSPIFKGFLRGVLDRDYIPVLSPRGIIGLLKKQQLALSF